MFTKHQQSAITVQFNFYIHLLTNCSTNMTACDLQQFVSLVTTAKIIIHIKLPICQ